MSKRVTIQNYPREAVWLDGSVPVTGWVKDGTAWRKDGWTTRFDASPSYTKGAPDGDGARTGSSSAPTTRWPPTPTSSSSTARRCARSPAAARSCRARSTSTTATSRVYIGSNPTGKEVLGSTLTKALAVRAAGTVVRGIGVRATARASGTSGR